MKFELSEDQRLLRDSTREFLVAEYPLERSRRIMEHDPKGYDSAGWPRLAEMGFLGIHIPAEYGGQGLGMIELAIVLEEMGRACFPGPFLDVALAGALLATAKSQTPLVAKIAAGESIVTIAREDSPFLGRVEMPLRAAGGRIAGTMYFVPFAAEAEKLVVITADGACVVDGPFDATPMPTIDPAQRFARVALDAPSEALTADANVLARQDDVAATAAAAMLLGIMSRAFDITLEYVKTRQAFGKPIGAFQALQHRLAEQLVRIESTRSAVYRAAWCLDHDPAEAPLAAASAKAYAGDAARLVCGESIQMHGGIGFTWELDVHFFFKRAKTIETFYGSTEQTLERALAAAGL
jgi:alkylation response protein AidB-like acyl-CoA dehydrogenase